MSQKKSQIIIDIFSIILCVSISVALFLVPHSANADNTKTIFFHELISILLAIGLPFSIIHILASFTLLKKINQIEVLPFLLSNIAVILSPILGICFVQVLPEGYDHRFSSLLLMAHFGGIGNVLIDSVYYISKFKKTQ